MLPTSSKSTALLLSILPLLPVFAEELAQKDVPPACTAICGPMVTLTNICDINPSGSGTNGTRSGSENSESDEPIEAACICGNTSFDVKKVAALCAACLTQNRGKGADDMDDIMSQCTFASTTFVPAATSAVAGVTVVATKPATTGLGAGGAGTGTGAGGGGAGTGRTSSGSGAAATGTSGATKLSLTGPGMSGLVFTVLGTAVAVGAGLVML